MLNFRRFSLGLLAITLLSPGVLMADAWILGPVNVIDANTGAIAAQRSLVIDDGKIIAIEEAGAQREGFRNVDGKNGYVIPGLAEMHAHVPSANRGAQYTEDVLTLFLAHGITTIRGMLGEPGHLELREQLAQQALFGPRLITSGPSFNGNSVSSADQGMDRVRDQKAAGYDFLKIHPGLSREEFIAIAETARDAGIPIAGHVSFETGLDTALAQRQATIDHLDAYAEAMVPEDHSLYGQAPQFFGLNLAAGMEPSMAPELARKTAEAGVWNVPTQSLFETTTGELSLEALKARPGMEYLGPELTQGWSESVTNIRGQMTPETRVRFLEARRALLQSLQASGAPLLLGSDAPQIMNVPGISTHQELVYLVGAGLTPLEALQSGTVNVARFLSDDTGGVIAPGKTADLVVLEANPLEDISNSTRIIGVARQGTWYNREDLDRRLEAVRERKL